MPVVRLTTNVELSKIPAEFETAITDKLAELMNKPKKNVTVIVRREERMCRECSLSPCAIVQVNAVNVLDEARNPTYAKAIRDILSTYNLIPNERLYGGFTMGCDLIHPDEGIVVYEFEGPWNKWMTYLFQNLLHGSIYLMEIDICSYSNNSG